MRKYLLAVFLLVFVCALSTRLFSEEPNQPVSDLDQLEKSLEELSADAEVAEDASEPEGVKQEQEEESSEEAEEPAQKEKARVISDIEIRGNQIVSTNTILSKIKERPGQPLQQTTVNEDLKRLYATGFFQDIKMEVEEQSEGYKLVIFVVEKPIVRQIIFEGFSIFNEEKLRKELKIIEGQILDQRVVKEGVQAVRKLYSDKGFRFVDIQSDLDVNQDTKEATIYIKIEEGAKYKITSIDFEGNSAFPQKKLLKLMKTKKKGWFFRKGVFKEEEFQKDMERVLLFYQQEGYLDAKVMPSFDYNKETQTISIKILVEENQHYVTGDIQIKGNRLFPESEIWQELEMLPGMTYSQFYLSKDVESIRDYYFRQGYMDARIIPDVKLNRSTGKVDLLYEIQEGDLYFVEKVLIRGNTKTKDIVIRRELRIRPGDQFDGQKIDKSKQKLENLGYFEEVTYDTEPSPDASNRKDLIFRVKEKRTGELSFGGGVSSIDAFVGFAEISQRNFDLLNWPRFTGGGQTLSLSARVGTISQNYNLSFVEPYLFNKPISLGADLFSINRDDRNVDFDQERQGFALTISKLFRDIIRLGTGYTLERVELNEISDDAPLTVRNFEGVNWLSRWRFFTTYDTRDNVFRPAKGILASFNADLVGSFLGGTQDFYVLQGSIAKYWSFLKKHIIETKFTLGTSREFGSSNEVPVFDRFYAGGLGTVRGYNFRRVGPIESGDAVGGQTMAVINLEYNFPIPYLDAFQGAFFIDAGHVNRESYKLGFGDFAVSIGPGLKIKTPIGPVAFYYGLPIANKDVEDRNGRLEFSLSRGF